MEIFNLIFGSLLLLTGLWVAKDREEDLSKFIEERSDSLNLPDIKTYDFIIVGGGLAGSVLASKLSEYYTVLVLEYGGNPPPTTYIPANGPMLNTFEDITFVLPSQPHEEANIDNDGIINCYAGKVLGGSSITNGLVYHRGSRYDFDNWTNLTDDPSWSWDSLLPIFKRVENYKGEFPSDEFHGTGGPLTISRQKYAPGLDLWLEAARELGYPINDPNVQTGSQFSPIEFNHKNGKRESVYDVYLKPILGRESLTILRYSEVENVILDEENKVALGVQFKRHGVDNVAYASKEVILSAGTFGTPKILLRSGIGPREYPEIPLKVQLPVGENLQDHPGISIQALVNSTDPEVLFFPERDYTLESIREFEEDGEGPLTYASWGAIAVGYGVSSRAIAEGHPNWPDIQYALQSHFGGNSLADPNTHIISNYIFVGRIKSHGFLRLNREDPASVPEFGFNYFTGPGGESDLQVLIEAIRVGIRLFETDAYAKIGATIIQAEIPECPFTWGSDEYWACYIKRRTGGFLHPVGSCPMGKVGDPRAVVDSKFRVIGIDGLRIIDASIIPEIVNSNTQAPTLIIAEKGAEELLDLWGRPEQTESPGVTGSTDSSSSDAPGTDPTEPNDGGGANAIWANFIFIFISILLII